MADDQKRTAVFAWGSAMQGQLGLGLEAQSVLLKRKIDELDDIPLKHIDAFGDKTALVTQDGDLVFWGWTGNGSFADSDGKPYQANLVSPTVFNAKDGSKFS